MTLNSMITKISDYRIYENHFNVIHKLNEGLIMTHDIYESTKIISDFISNKYGFHNIDIKDNKIELTFSYNVNSILFIEILTTINNLGYYISTMNITDNKNRIKKILIEDFKRLYLNDTDLSSFIKYEILLEPKFDTKHELKNTRLNI